MKYRQTTIDSDGVVHVWLEKQTFCGKTWVLPRKIDEPVTCLYCISHAAATEQLDELVKNLAKRQGYVPTMVGRRKRF